MEEEKEVVETTKETEEVKEESTPTVDDLKISLEASKQLIDEQTKANKKMAEEMHDLKVELAKLTLKVGQEKPLDDGEIFGAFNKYNNKKGAING